MPFLFRLFYLSAFVVFAVVFMLFIFACAALAGTPKEDIVSPYVMVKIGDGGCGSGALVRIDGQVYVLTAGHCVDESLPYQENAKPLVLVQGKTEVEGEVAFYSAPEESGGNDLALIKPRKPLPGRPALCDFSQRPEYGDDVWYIGTPGGTYGVLEKTIVADPDFEGLDKTWLLLNGNGWFGNSGGGVYVKSGDDHVLVGVVTRITSTRNPKASIMAQRPEVLADFVTKFRAKRERP